MYEVTDEWLYKYMPVVDEAMIRSLERTTEETYSFSRGLERSMRKVIFRERYSLLAQKKGILKRIAAWFVGVIGAFSLVTFGVEAFRMIYYGTFVEEYEDHVVKTFEVYEDAPFVACEPEYIPEGYELYDSLGDNVARIWNYQNEKGEILTLDQFKAMSGATYVADSEYDFVEIIYTSVGEVEIKLYETGPKYVYYEYGNSVFVLWADDLSVEEIGKIIDGWIG